MTFTHKGLFYDVTYKIRASSTPSISVRPASSRDILVVSEMTYTVSSGTLNPTVPYHPVTSSRSSRSVDTRRLQTQRTRTELGRRAFSVATSTVWNSLPAQQRLSGSLSTFKNYLKTLLFTSAF